MSNFPPLDGFEPTRQTLHLYSQAVGVVPRAHAPVHPKWWHISLKVRPNGLVTDNIPLPDGGILALRLDLRRHQIMLETSREETAVFDMTAGLTGTEMGTQIITAVAEFGLEGEYARARFKNDEPREYDPEKAKAYFDLLVQVDTLLRQHKASLDGETGPVQVWPHGFDVAFEWFGTRMEVVEEKGEVQAYPAQLSLGFYPGGPGVAPYFYSNPFPFEADVLLDQPLPPGAAWHTEGWQGSIFPYAELVGDVRAAARVQAYAKRVFELARPTLMASE